MTYYIWIISEGGCTDPNRDIHAHVLPNDVIAVSVCYVPAIPVIQEHLRYTAAVDMRFSCLRIWNDHER